MTRLTVEINESSIVMIPHTGDLDYSIRSRVGILGLDFHGSSRKSSSGMGTVATQGVCDSRFIESYYPLKGVVESLRFILENAYLDE